MSLFSTKRTRQAIKHATKQRSYLVNNAKVQAHSAGMFYFERNDGSVLLADKHLKTHILVDPKITRRGKLVPMIRVMTEEKALDDDDTYTDVLEISNMVTTPEMTLGRLIHQYV